MASDVAYQMKNRRLVGLRPRSTSRQGTPHSRTLDVYARMLAGTDCVMDWAQARVR